MGVHCCRAESIAKSLFMKQTAKQCYNLKIEADFCKAVKALTPELQAYAVIYGTSPDEAKDFVQELWMKAWQENWADIELLEAAWLKTVLKNSIIDHYRGMHIRKVVKKSTDELAESVPGSHYACGAMLEAFCEREDLHDFALDFLSKLDKRYREVMELACDNPVDFNRVASVLNRKKSTVKKQYQRVRKQFREAVHKWEKQRKRGGGCLIPFHSKGFQTFCLPVNGYFRY